MSKARGLQGSLSGNGVTVLIGMTLLGPLVAAGADGRWVSPDGRKFDLVRSPDELAVRLRNAEDLEVSAKRLSQAGEGKLENFKLAPDARFKLLRVSRVDASRLDRIRQDPAVVDVRPIYRFAGVESPVIATGTLNLKVEPGLTAAEAQKLWSDYGVVSAVPVHGQPGVFSIAAAVDQDEILLAEILADDQRVDWAQPNFRREVKQHQVTPSDQYFDLQWHLNNTGQTAGTAGADIDALEAWSITTGTGILFGCFDDAVDVDHEDLRDNYIGIGQDPSLATTDPGYTDPRPKDFGDRHGTATMGLAVARANARGGRGVAYNAKFTASRGLVELVSDAQIASVYLFARDQNVDVHYNSWSFSGTFPNPEIVVDSINVAYATGRNKGDLDGDGTDDPLGMVILFSAGNAGRELPDGFVLQTLPQVIAVGASNDDDERSLYSSFGETVSILAPSDDVTSFSVNAGIFTTDNPDSNEVDKGYNEGGFNFGSGFETDTTGNYTEFFGGTSASCPIAAGVAGLILSVNPELTATDVRMLLEHTADRIAFNDADYDPVTSHSLTYGYGRVNAGGAGDAKVGAVEAAQETLANGGITWPDRAADVTVDDVSIRWIQNPGTTEFLVVQSDNDFDFIPEDGECYAATQSNCLGELQGLPAGVTVLATGCGLTCTGTAGDCTTGAEQCVLLPAGTKTFAIYARNSVGRYSWGVELDSAGNVNGSGTFIDTGAIGDVIVPTGPPPSRPQVTISVSPLQGTSPLTVNFMGNAISPVPIDESRTFWDFDIDQPPDADSTNRNTVFTYLVPDQQTRTFVARLTMYDTNGTPGSAEVAIRVDGQDFTGDDGGLSSGNLQIIVGLPETPEANVSSGVSPFDVLLSVNASGLPGTLQAISWDLGDGTTADSLVVSHTYVNEGQSDLRIPITVTVSTATSQNQTILTTATRIITVEPGTSGGDGGEIGPCVLPGTCAEGPGGSVSPCGGGSAMLPVIFVTLTLARIRRKPR